MGGKTLAEILSGRVKYTRNLRLEEEHFRREQQFHLDLLEWFVSHFHAPGIVHGLDYSPSQRTVAAGVAVDAHGRLLVLNQPARLAEARDDLLVLRLPDRGESAASRDPAHPHRVTRIEEKPEVHWVTEKREGDVEVSSRPCATLRVSRVRVDGDLEVKGLVRVETLDGLLENGARRLADLESALGGVPEETGVEEIDQAVEETPPRLRARVEAVTRFLVELGAKGGAQVGKSPGPSPPEGPSQEERAGRHQLARTSRRAGRGVELSPPTYIHGEHNAPRLLTALDFTREQTYRIDSLLNLWLPLHTEGILEGLEVQENSLTVSPGVAVDGNGRILVLSSPQRPEGSDPSKVLVLRPRRGRRPRSAEAALPTRLEEAPSLEWVREEEAGAGVPVYPGDFRVQAGLQTGHLHLSSLSEGLKVTGELRATSVWVGGKEMSSDWKDRLEQLEARARSIDDKTKESIQREGSRLSLPDLIGRVTREVEKLEHLAKELRINRRIRGTKTNPRILVRGGTFKMGDKLEVQVSSFYMQRHPVTNEEFRVFNPRHQFASGEERYPVVNVSWEDARRYAEWLGGRLPTEAEWEFAARGTESRKYPWGSEPPSCLLANYDECGKKIQAVATHPKGATPEGVEDLGGNVYEWCQDWWGDLPDKPQKDPTGPESRGEGAFSGRVIRGGSWFHVGWLMENQRRTFAYSLDGDDRTGFRVVWSDSSGGA